jgi:5-formyltetrahydrofolate cyclo-ligase
VNKSQIRKKISKIRKKKNYKYLNIDFKKILKIVKKEKMRGKLIGGYYPYNYEINVLKILNNFEKKKYKILLPKIRKNSQMDFFHWSKDDPLTVNKYGIPEPTSFKKKYPNILLVPLIAYDKHLNRVGYGGGFYDRYIKRIKEKKNIITIGLAYSFQKVKKVPINKNDMKLDFVVTEKV